MSKAKSGMRGLLVYALGTDPKTWKRARRKLDKMLKEHREDKASRQLSVKEFRNAGGCRCCKEKT